MSLLTPSTAKTPTRTRGAGRLRGQVVYLFAFDLAYDMKRGSLPTLCGQPVSVFQMDASKRSPKQLFFYRPQMVRLPPVEKFAARGGLVRLETVVKIMPVGALSISIRVPFEVDSLRELVDYHDLRFQGGGGVIEDARELGEQVRRELLPQLINPVPQLGDVEAYTAFCIEGPLQSVYPVGDGNTAVDVSAEQWLATHRRDIAAVLTQEEDADLLSSQEAEESSSRYFSYYQDDLCVIDWDAALVVDEEKEFDETLYLMELANVQLAELEAYDRLLDDAVENAYRDLKGGSLWRSRGTQRNLRELRVDAARINDELSNITKFFGDWHSARLYQGLAARFHIADWHGSVRAKLQAIDELYQLLHADGQTRTMIFLELVVVVLFVIEVVQSFVH